VTAPTTPLQIDFVSDIACPWCAVGLHALQTALNRVAPTITAHIECQPFELNPAMPPEGQDVVEHLMAKYGIGPEQFEQNRAVLHARGAEVGFYFGTRSRSGARIWNTFDAHRLLHWAGLPGQPEGAQWQLKQALLKAYHGDGANPGDAALLTGLAAQVGLDASEAAEVLASGRFADEVRETEAMWQEAGIRAVPAVVINRKHLISGGQPAEAFEQALRHIAAGAA
jgi:predicted DsbA family dithiol-disulfide isomerase